MAHKYHYIRCISATETKIEGAVNSVTRMVCGASPTSRCSGGNLPQSCTHALSRGIRRGCEGGCVCGGDSGWLECVQGERMDEQSGESKGRVGYYINPGMHFISEFSYYMICTVMWV